MAVPCALYGFVPGTADVVIVMEDLAAKQGDQIGGCSFDEAALAPVSSEASQCLLAQKELRTRVGN